MKTSDSQSNPQPTSSALPTIAAVLVLLACGTAYRTLAAHYVDQDERPLLPPGTLARLPTQLGDWRGRDVKLEDRIIKATDTDQILTRRYARGGGVSVSLLLTYGVRLRDLLPHRPEVCYTTNGWTMRRTDSDTLSSRDTGPIPCQLHTFDRAGIGAESLVVLHYYLVDGEACQDVSLLRSKAAKKDASAHYMAQVQIAVQADPLAPETSLAIAREFAVLSAPHIRALFESPGTSQ